MKKPLIVIGAGGHSCVLADALLAGGRTILGFTSPIGGNRDVLGFPILGDDTELNRWNFAEIELVNGVGGVSTDERRSRIQLQLEAQGWRFSEVRHPSATVSPSALLADDVQILAHAVVQARARVGRGCIVNTGAIVEHDAVLEDWVHVAPGAAICGEVEIGAGSHVGAGAVIRQRVHLGARTLVGIGAAVVKDFPGAGCLAGVPARPIKTRTDRHP